MPRSTGLPGCWMAAVILVISRAGLVGVWPAEDIGNADPRGIATLCLNALGCTRAAGQALKGSGRFCFRRLCIWPCAPKSKRGNINAFNAAMKDVASQTSHEPPLAFAQRADQSDEASWAYIRVIATRTMSPRAYAAGEDYFPEAAAAKALL